MAAGKILTVILCLLVWGCNQKKKEKTYPAVPGYNFMNPVVIHLRSDLDEISGLNFYPKDTSIFAINDEQGVLYKIFIRNKIKVQTWKFSGLGDYEDLLLHDSIFYALQSNGNIQSFKFVLGKPLHVDSWHLPIRGRNEFESLYFDSSANRLVLLCKDCEADSRKIVTAYSFNPIDDLFSEQEYFRIDVEKVAELLGTNKIKFRPSAAAIHPVTNELYIISAVANALVIANKKGVVKKAYQLNPALFKQPEGLTFTPNGDLIICNEAAEIGAANLLIFKYKPVLHEKG